MDRNNIYSDSVNNNLKTSLLFKPNFNDIPKEKKNNRNNFQNDSNLKERTYSTSSTKTNINTIPPLNITNNNQVISLVSGGSSTLNNDNISNVNSVFSSGSSKTQSIPFSPVYQKQLHSSISPATASSTRVLISSPSSSNIPKMDYGNNDVQENYPVVNNDKNYDHFENFELIDFYDHLKEDISFAENEIHSGDYKRETEEIAKEINLTETEKVKLLSTFKELEDYQMARKQSQLKGSSLIENSTLDELLKTDFNKFINNSDKEKIESNTNSFVESGSFSISTIIDKFNEKFGKEGEMSELQSKNDIVNENVTDDSENKLTPKANSNMYKNLFSESLLSIVLSKSYSSIKSKEDGINITQPNRLSINTFGIGPRSSVGIPDEDVNDGNNGNDNDNNGNAIDVNNNNGNASDKANNNVKDTDMANSNANTVNMANSNTNTVNMIKSNDNTFEANADGNTFEANAHGNTFEPNDNVNTINNNVKNRKEVTSPKHHETKKVHLKPDAKEGYRGQMILTEIKDELNFDSFNSSFDEYSEKEEDKPKSILSEDPDFSNLKSDSKNKFAYLEDYINNLIVNTSNDVKSVVTSPPSSPVLSSHRRVRSREPSLSPTTPVSRSPEPSSRVIHTRSKEKERSRVASPEPEPEIPVRRLDQEIRRKRPTSPEIPVRNLDMEKSRKSTISSLSRVGKEKNRESTYSSATFSLSRLDKEKRRERPISTATFGRKVEREKCRERSNSATAIGSKTEKDKSHDSPALSTQKLEKGKSHDSPLSQAASTQKKRISLASTMTSSSRKNDEKSKADGKQRIKVPSHTSKASYSSHSRFLEKEDEIPARFSSVSSRTRPIKKGGVSPYLAPKSPSIAPKDRISGVTITSSVHNAPTSPYLHPESNNSKTRSKDTLNSIESYHSASSGLNEPSHHSKLDPNDSKVKSSSRSNKATSTATAKSVSSTVSKSSSINKVNSTTTGKASSVNKVTSKTTTAGKSTSTISSKSTGTNKVASSTASNLSTGKSTGINKITSNTTSKATSTNKITSTAAARTTGKTTGTNKVTSTATARTTGKTTGTTKTTNTSSKATTSTTNKTINKSQNKTITSSTDSLDRNLADKSNVSSCGSLERNLADKSYASSSGSLNRNLAAKSNASSNGSLNRNLAAKSNASSSGSLNRNLAAKSDASSNGSLNRNLAAKSDASSSGSLNRNLAAKSDASSSGSLNRNMAIKTATSSNGSLNRNMPAKAKSPLVSNKSNTGRPVHKKKDLTRICPPPFIPLPKTPEEEENENLTNTNPVISIIKSNSTDSKNSTNNVPAINLDSYNGGKNLTVSLLKVLSEVEEKNRQIKKGKGKELEGKKSSGLLGPMNSVSPAFSPISPAISPISPAISAISPSISPSMRERNFSLERIRENEMLNNSNSSLTHSNSTSITMDQRSLTLPKVNNKDSNINRSVSYSCIPDHMKSDRNENLRAIIRRTQTRYSTKEPSLFNTPSTVFSSMSSIFFNSDLKECKLFSLSDNDYSSRYSRYSSRYSSYYSSYYSQSRSLSHNRNISFASVASIPDNHINRSVNRVSCINLSVNQSLRRRQSLTTHICVSDFDSIVSMDMNSPKDQSKNKMYLTGLTNMTSSPTNEYQSKVLDSAENSEVESYDVSSTSIMKPYIPNFDSRTATYSICSTQLSSTIFNYVNKETLENQRLFLKNKKANAHGGTNEDDDVDVSEVILSSSSEESMSMDNSMPKAFSTLNRASKINNFKKSDIFSIGNKNFTIDNKHQSFTTSNGYLSFLEEEEDESNMTVISDVCIVGDDGEDELDEEDNVVEMDGAEEEEYLDEVDALNHAPVVSSDMKYVRGHAKKPSILEHDPSHKAHSNMKISFNTKDNAANTGDTDNIGNAGTAGTAGTSGIAGTTVTAGTTDTAGTPGTVLKPSLSPSSSPSLTPTTKTNKPLPSPTSSHTTINKSSKPLPSPTLTNITGKSRISDLSAKPLPSPSTKSKKLSDSGSKPLPLPSSSTSPKPSSIKIKSVNTGVKPIIIPSNKLNVPIDARSVRSSTNSSPTSGTTSVYPVSPTSTYPVSPTSTNPSPTNPRPNRIKEMARERMSMFNEVNSILDRLLMTSLPGDVDQRADPSVKFNQINSFTRLVGTNPISSMDQPVFYSSIDRQPTTLYDFVVNHPPIEKPESDSEPEPEPEAKDTEGGKNGRNFPKDEIQQISSSIDRHFNSLTRPIIKGKNEMVSAMKLKSLGKGFKKMRKMLNKKVPVKVRSSSIYIDPNGCGVEYSLEKVVLCDVEDEEEASASVQTKEQ